MFMFQLLPNIWTGIILIWKYFIKLLQTILRDSMELGPSLHNAFKIPI